MKSSGKYRVDISAAILMGGALALHFLPVRANAQDIADIRESFVALQTRMANFEAKYRVENRVVPPPGSAIKTEASGTSSSAPKAMIFDVIARGLNGDLRNDQYEVTGAAQDPSKPKITHLTYRGKSTYIDHAGRYAEVQDSAQSHAKLSTPLRYIASGMEEALGDEGARLEIANGKTFLVTAKARLNLDPDKDFAVLNGEFVDGDGAFAESVRTTGWEKSSDGVWFPRTFEKQVFKQSSGQKILVREQKVSFDSISLSAVVPESSFSNPIPAGYRIHDVTKGDGTSDAGGK